MPDRTNRAANGWNFADVFETIAHAIPNRPALICGDRVVTWRNFDRRANALAGALSNAGISAGSNAGISGGSNAGISAGSNAGISAGSKVAAYLPNRPEYLETYFAAQKLGAWPVNTNYRYGPDEITYLFDNADAEAVVFDTRFAETADAVRGRLPGVRAWYAVGPDRPDWALDYEALVAPGADQPPAATRTADDVVLVYTGGTTGMPKGVMWTHGELFKAIGHGGSAILDIPPVQSLEELGEAVAARPGGPVVLEACPLMHATALGNAYGMLSIGGTIAMLESEKFDAGELWDTVDRLEVNWLTMVGDAFGRPLLAELEANPGRWSLQSLRIVYSAGVMWSREVKEGMVAHFRDDAVLIDVFGSTEAAGMGSSVSRNGDVAETASFAVGELAQVLTEDGDFVEPGSGVIGLAAFGGPMPSGYYKDPVKSAETFRLVNGRRWAVPGDFATVEADGSMKLLGRGSVCINTGGEKVFVEEVEEVLKLHPGVRDAVCVGIPDARFGETVCAVIEPADGVGDIDGPELMAHVKTKLAGYKAPRDVVNVDSIGRAPSGKVDYKGLRALARERLGR